MTKAKNLETLILEAQEDLVDGFQKLDRRTYEELNTRLELAREALINYITKVITNAVEPNDFAKNLAAAKAKALQKAKDEKERAYLEKSFAVQEKNYKNRYGEIQMAKLLEAKQKYLDFANITRNPFANLVSAVVIGARVLRIPGSMQIEGQTPEERGDIRANACSLLSLMIYAEFRTSTEALAEVDSKLVALGYINHIQSHEIRKEKFCEGKDKNDIVVLGQTELSKITNEKSISDALKQKTDPYNAMYG